MYRIFIVEDDRGIAQAIQEQAEMWGLQAKCAGDFRNVLAEFAGYDPHLVLLDISLPFYNGYHWCSEIRQVSKVPIIFISSSPQIYGKLPTVLTSKFIVGLRHPNKYSTIFELSNPNNKNSLPLFKLHIPEPPLPNNA